MLDPHHNLVCQFLWCREFRNLHYGYMYMMFRHLMFFNFNMFWLDICRGGKVILLKLLLIWYLRLMMFFHCSRHWTTSEEMDGWSSPHLCHKRWAMCRIICLQVLYWPFRLQINNNNNNKIANVICMKFIKTWKYYLYKMLQTTFLNW